MPAAQTTTPTLQVQDLTVVFKSPHGDTPATKGVSYHVSPGEVVCLVGESGSGKTVSALAAMGLLPERASRIEQGTITFDGTDLATLTAEQLRKLRGAQMGMIFQEPMTSLNPVFKVGEQVAEVFEVHTRMTPAQRKAKVLELFGKVRLGDPQRCYNAYPNQLSGGQRQRVMIAMALAMSPKLLIADEPTTALDVTIQFEIIKLIKSLQKEFKMAVLFITHDFGVVKELGDRVVVMQNGQVVEEGPVKQVMTHPKADYTKHLLAAMPTLSRKKADAAQKNTPLFEVSGLGKTFHIRKGGYFSATTPFKALDDVSITLSPGENLGIVGESGSGKSTLARCLVGLYRPDGGMIQFKGQDVSSMKGKTLKTMRRDVQMVFQDPFGSLNPRQRVGDAVAEGIRAHKLLDKPKQRPYVEKLLEDCGLPAGSYDRYPHQFSGGQRQRICIARALALQPAVIIADEAVSALDVSVQKQILELMAELKREYGLSYIFISHDLRVVSQFCSRVVVMKNGRVVEQGATSDVFFNPRDPYTRHLLASIPGEEGAAQPLPAAAKSGKTKGTAKSRGK